MNADVAAGLLPCPFAGTTFAACPVPPFILASAFAAGGFSGAYATASNAEGVAVAGAQYLGSTSVANWQTQARACAPHSPHSSGRCVRPGCTPRLSALSRALCSSRGTRRTRAWST